MPYAAAELSLADEQVLVARAQKGERGALGELLRRFGPDIYRTVLLPRLGNPMVAEQALADTYARVVERLGQFEWQGVSFRAWLRTVALHVALDLLRAHRREVLFVPDDLEREVQDAERGAATESPADAFERHAERAAVRRRLEAALLAMNPRYAEAIRLRIIDEVPREEVARQLGIKPATFDVLLHRAVAALRKALTASDCGADRRPAGGPQ